MKKRTGEAMEILHINSNYAGTALHRNLTVRLRTLEDKPFVFAPVRTDTALPKEEPDVICVPCFTRADRYFFFRKQRRILRAAETAVGSRTFGLIHAHTLFTDGGCARRLSGKTGTPYIAAVRATDLIFFRRRPLLREEGRKTLAGASAVIFLSEQVRDRVLESWVPAAMREAIRAKSRVIPNGIDDFWLSNRPPVLSGEREGDARPVRLLAVAKIIRRKNLPMILRAMRILDRQGRECTLDVIGEAADGRLARKLAADPRVTLRHAVPKEELLPAYRRADLFVLPSRNETFGLVYAEAMSQGLPVIYTRGEGFDGQFPDGTVGRAVSPDDPREIAAAIADCMERRDELSVRASELAQRFDWTGIVGQYAQIYRDARAPVGDG